LNAGQSPVSVDHARQESGKRKTVVPEMSVSESLGVMDRKYEIEYQKPKNNDSDLEHGSEIIKLCLTASLLNKVHYSSLWSKYIIWLQDSFNSLITC
jgi:predicted nucleic acid-binding protein